MEMIERFIDFVFFEVDYRRGFEAFGKVLFAMASVASVGYWIAKFGWAIISFLYMMD